MTLSLTITLWLYIFLFNQFFSLILRTLMCFGLLLFLLFLFSFLLTFHEEVVAHPLLLLVLLRVKFVDTGAEIGGVAAESDVHELQEFVHTTDQSLG